VSRSSDRSTAACAVVAAVSAASASISPASRTRLIAAPSLHCSGSPSPAIVGDPYVSCGGSIGGMSEERALLWLRDDEPGAEWCVVRFGPGRLSATGVQLGAHPVPYRLDYRLETGPGFVTRELRVRSAGAGWSRLLTLRRDEDGRWAVGATAAGDAPLDPPGGDPGPLAGAYDCDLGFSPLTNTLPVRRLDLLARPGADEPVLAAWVRVPDLVMVPSKQRYTAHGSGRVRFAAGDFAAELTLDADGVIVRYPGLARLA